MENTDIKKNKKKIIIVGILIIIVFISITTIIINTKNKKSEESKPIDNSSEVDEQKDYIILNDNLNFEINSEVRLISLITDTNNTKILNENDIIDTSVLGEKEITIKFKINNEIKEKIVKINIVDTEAPIIEYKKELSTTVGTTIDLLKDVKVSDNSNEKIKVTVEGEYDIKKEGTYNLKYVAVDSSNNKKEENFILKVNKKDTKPSSKTQASNDTTSNKNEEQTDSKKKCTQAKALPEGAVWYKTWGDAGIGYSSYRDWAESIDDSKMLYDELDKMESAYGGNNFRTDGGLVQVNCKGENFYVYGAYIVINGYETYNDDNGKPVEIQTEKGYVKPDGTITWVYKKY